MTAVTAKCPSCAAVEAENAVLRALLEDEREANIHLQTALRRASEAREEGKPCTPIQ